MWVTTGVNHGRKWSTKPQCRNNSEQERVSRAQYDTRDTYGGCIYKQYGHYNA